MDPNAQISKYRREQRDRLRRNIKDDTHEGPLGELRWNSNENPVPMHVFKDADLEAPRAQEQAEKASNVEAIDKYRMARSNLTQEQLDEEAFERRAAFGPGEVVFDILTGERYRT